MNLKYLCANHRQWLTADTLRAEQAWLDWSERGNGLCEEGSYAEAIPYLGCAFELANILLDARWPDYPDSVGRFSASARQLMEAYRRRGEGRQCNYILVGASSRLARELKDRDNYRITADGIRALYADQSDPPARQPWQQGLAGVVRLH